MQVKVSGSLTVVIVVVRAVVRLAVRNGGTPAAYEYAVTALGVALCEIGPDISGFVDKRRQDIRRHALVSNNSRFALDTAVEEIS